MNIDERFKYVRLMCPRYQAAPTRAAQGALLDEMEAMTGLHRKSLLRLLSGPLQRQPRPQERGCTYGLEVEQALAVIAESLDYVCAERLQPYLLETAELLAAHGELDLPPALREQLATISLSSVARHAPRARDNPDRVVIRAAPRRNTLQQQIPAGRIAWDIAEPGHLEMDLVFHSGPHPQGEFGYTLQLVDVATGWAVRRAVLGRSACVIMDACQYVFSQHLPFPLREVHPDNGSEFLNAPLVRFLRDFAPELTLSRSRPYCKNDNRNVEQKNATLVRAFLGDYRLDTVQQIRYLNTLYDTFYLYYNFCQPVLHLVEKRYIPATETAPAHIRRVYDAARPPVVRLADAQTLPAAQLAQLEAQRQALNPRQLRRTFYAGLDHLFGYPGATPGKVENVFETLAFPERFAHLLGEAWGE